MNLNKLIFGVLFMKGKDGSTVKELSTLLNVKQNEIIKAVSTMKKELDASGFPITLQINGSKCRVTVSEEVSKDLSARIDNTVNFKLSKTLVEILTIIAYKQPITKIEIEKIKGNSIDSSITRLLDFNLIEEAGKLEKKGTPILYRTTDRFLEIFNLKSLSELPKIDQEISLDSIESGSLFDNDNE